MNMRIHYLDVTKGVLILCLMLSHLGSATRRLGIENEWFIVINFWAPFYACFFMQCFFLISGYCSSFKGSLLSFLKKQFRQIVIPWLSFEIIGQFLTALFWGNLNGLNNLLIPPHTTLWFFSALLLSKIVCFICSNYIKSNYIVLGSNLLLLLSALILNQFNIPNILAFQNAMAACFFVTLGHIIKKKGLNNRILVLGMIIYIFSILSLKIFDISIPVLDANVSNVGWVFLPIILVITISGSFACLLICKWINHCRFLEYFGKNSIIVYGLHFVPLLYIVKFYTTYIIPDGVFSMLLLAFLIYGTLLIILFFLIKLFNTKYLKWIIGR